MIELQKKKEILRGYFHEVVGAIDFENIEFTLAKVVKRKGMGMT